MLVNSHQYMLTCIGILAAIVLNTGTLDLKQVMSAFWDFFRDCPPIARRPGSRTARLPKWQRVTCARRVKVTCRVLTIQEASVLGGTTSRCMASSRRLLLSYLNKGLVQVKDACGGRNARLFFWSSSIKSFHHVYGF